MLNGIRELIHAAPVAEPELKTAAAVQASEPVAAAPVEVAPAPVASASVVKPITASANNAALTGVLDIVPATKPSSIPALPFGAIPLFDRDGRYVAIRKPDNTYVTVTVQHDEDPIGKLSAEDRRPRDEAEEARTDLAPRTAGRIVFLWESYEKHDLDPNPATNPRLQKRLANDLARAGVAHAANAKPFDPESSRGAQEIKNWLA